MEKYYYDRAMFGMCLQDCPIKKGKGNIGGVIRVGSCSCRECENCEEYSNVDVSEFWIKCKYVSKKSNKGILIKIAAVLVWLILAIITFGIAFSTNFTHNYWIIPCIGGCVSTIVANYIWNLSNKK